MCLFHAKPMPQHMEGTQLKPEMPRWNISNDDLADLIALLKTLP
jgi:hypothetical protein